MTNLNQNELPLYIDTDNALGSPFGDIDDAFAIVALLKSGKPIEALSSVFGNSFEPWVFKNNKKLQELCRFEGPLLRGAQTWWSGPTQSSQYLASLDHRVRVVAMGPMTNIALALRQTPTLPDQVAEVIFIGTNRSIPLPAFRFIDFNQWKDPKATRKVFDSNVALTCIPCDVARNFRLSDKELESLPGPLGKHIRVNAARWFKRSRFIKGLSSVPIWDLVPALYAIRPDMFTVEATTAELGRMGQAVFGAVGGRPLQVVTKFDSKKLWEYFLSLLGE